MVWIIISCVLLSLCVVLLIYTISLKHQMIKMRKELASTEDFACNRQLSIALFDRDLNSLAVQMNHNLDYQKQLKYKSQQSELTLRQSVSDIAHDLRTPLTVLRGNLQLLEQETCLNASAKERLHICHKKALELGEMVDDFFEMSVLESDTEPAVTEKLDITKVLIQFLADHETLIREHHLTPNLLLPERSLFIPANEKLLLRMLENLLGNIVKYARDSFTLSLASVENNLCKICFSNEIHPEHQVPDDASQLFQRTYRGSQARNGKGAGLGLYIVKLLAEKQGAEAIAVKNENRLEISVFFRTAK